MILSCKECLKDLDSAYFVRTKNNNKYYYNTKKCKLCKSKSGRINLRSLETRSLFEGNKMSKECLDYLNTLERRKGLITDIDFYLIAHYHIQVFEYHETAYENPIEEILVMYKQLIASL